jgi:hypothetical protein
VTVVDDPHRGLRPRCGVRHRPHAVSPLGPAGLPQNAAHQYHDRHSGAMAVADARGDLLLVSSSIACLQLVNDVR